MDADFHSEEAFGGAPRNTFPTNGTHPRARHFQNCWIETEDLEKVVKHVQELEPAGIATRSIQECLLVQLQRMHSKRPDVKKAIVLLQDHYSDLRNRHMERIMNSLNIDEDELKIILQLISKLKQNVSVRGRCGRSSELK